MNRIVMVRGDSKTIGLDLIDSNGDPIDLTGADVVFTVGDIIQKTLSDGIVIDEPSYGSVTISIDPSDTEGLTARRVWPYDIQVTLADGTVKTPVRGDYVLLPDVTI
ncbi:MAG TPA: hypothetical protein VFA45_02165 [Actinomycetes bacterium]|jgi:hypothetical protein|nr:hypothetical protein [Actinomycetes bacterium]